MAAALPAPLPELRLSTANRVLDHWMVRTYAQPVARDPFDMDAPYQRGSVWTDDQRRALVRSLVMGLPVGAILTSQLPFTGGADYRIVDGKQRLLTIRGFCADEYTVPGWWWAEDQCAHRDRDVVFSDLTLSGQRRFGNLPVPELAYNGTVEFLRPRPDGKGWLTRTVTPEQLLVAEAHLFGLVNGGGTAQTPQDMARAAAVAAGGTGAA